MKTCRKCGVELIEGSNWYSSRVEKCDYICIECARAYACQWYKEHPDYEKPLIICKKCGREKPHHAHGLCKACYALQYERPLITCRVCGEKRPHLAHGLCKPCYSRQWGVEHYEEQIAYKRQWRAENRDKYRAMRRRRKARVKGASFVGLVDEAAIYELYNNCCVYCGSRDNLTLDHIVPLSKGGKHISENLLVACGSCNSSKGAKLLEEWIQSKPYLQAWVM